MGELTVMGYMAIIIWSLRQLGIFNYSNGDYDEDHNEDASWFELFPKKGYDLLHLIEDVHMQLFL